MSRSSKSLRRSVLPVVALAIPATLAVSIAYGQDDGRGKTLLLKFSPTQTLINGGRAILLSGPITCPAGDVQLRLTISQRSTGAVAEGSRSKHCTGKTQKLTWNATATVTDGVSFKAGDAHAGGLAILRRNGKPVDALQWLRPDVKIVSRKG